MASERAGKLIGLSEIILHMWFGICLVSTYESGIMLESRASKKKRDRLVIIWHQSSATSWAVPLRVFGETSTEETSHC
jgi:hypothetical protein